MQNLWLTHNDKKLFARYVLYKKATLPKISSYIPSTLPKSTPYLYHLLYPPIPRGKTSVILPPFDFLSKNSFL